MQRLSFEEEQILVYLGKQYGQDAMDTLRANLLDPNSNKLSEFRNLMKDVGQLQNININSADYNDAVNENTLKLNQMMLGNVTPGQTGSYETSPILRLAAFYQGNQRALVDYDPNKGISAIDQLNKTPSPYGNPSATPDLKRK